MGICPCQTGRRGNAGCDKSQRIMPRNELYPVKKLIGFDRAQLGAIEKWRRHQEPIPTVSEAIRRLVDMALASSKPRRGQKERETS